MGAGEYSVEILFLVGRIARQAVDHHPTVALKLGLNLSSLNNVS